MTTNKRGAGYLKREAGLKPLTDKACKITTFSLSFNAKTRKKRIRTWKLYAQKSKIISDDNSPVTVNFASLEEKNIELRLATGYVLNVLLLQKMELSSITYMRNSKCFCKEN